MAAHIGLEQFVPIISVDAESRRGAASFNEGQPGGLHELPDGATGFRCAATAVHALHKFPLQFLNVFRRALQSLVLFQHGTEFVCESLLAYALAVNAPPVGVAHALKFTDAHDCAFLFATSLHVLFSFWESAAIARLRGEKSGRIIFSHIA